jgi:hypothetical protein
VVEAQMLLLFPPLFKSHSDNALISSQFYEPFSVNESRREGLLCVDSLNNVLIHFIEIFPLQKIVQLNENNEKQPDKLIFYIHGNACNLETMWSQEAEKLSEKNNCSVISYDFRGSGKSSHSQISLEQTVEDAYNVFSKSVKNLKPRRIVLYGRSIGAAIVMNLASKLVDENIKFSIILETPMLGNKSLRNWLPISFCSEKFDCRLALNKTTYVKMLIGMAENDLLIDNDSVLENVIKFRGMSNNTTILKVSETTHNTVSDNPKWEQNVLDFLK